MSDPVLTHNASFKLSLRDLLFNSTVKPFWVFSEDVGDILKAVWDEAAEHLDEGDRREPDGLAAGEVYREADYLIRIIRCPEPTSMAENHFVAIAFRAGSRSFFPWKRKSEEIRYLALESSSDLVGNTKTVMGDWTKTGHLNYGPGPEPTEDAFVVALRPLLTGKARIEAGYVKVGNTHGTS
jgi:hypothetical protein